MNKFLILLTALLSSASLWAQRPFASHPNYVAGQRLLSQARLTNDYGDYDRAAALAASARSNMALADEWIRVLPLYPVVVSWAQTARTELSLSRPAEEPPSGAPTNSAMPWFSDLSFAIAQFELGLSAFTNAERLWVARPYSNGLQAAINAFTNAVGASKKVRDTQRQWAALQATRLNVSKLLAEAERQFTNAVQEQIVSLGDTNFTAIDSRITEGHAAFRSEQYATSEEKAVQALNLLNAIRLQVVARRTYEKAKTRMDALLARKPKSSPDLEAAQRDLSDAKSALDASKFEESIPLSERVLAYLDRAENDMELFAASSGKPGLPAFYKVRLIPQNRDCFWNIAKYSFVYKDPFQWPKIWQANKGLLQNPANPDLIQPGMRFVLPSITGEAREGEWVPDDPKAP
jgi:nucleoid-associated protein YgaU